MHGENRELRLDPHIQCTMVPYIIALQSERVNVHVVFCIIRTCECREGGNRNFVEEDQNCFAVPAHILSA